MKYNFEKETPSDAEKLHVVRVYKTLIPAVVQKELHKYLTKEALIMIENEKITPLSEKECAELIEDVQMKTARAIDKIQLPVSGRSITRKNVKHASRPLFNSTHGRLVPAYGGTRARSMRGGNRSRRRAAAPAPELAPAPAAEPAVANAGRAGFIPKTTKYHILSTITLLTVSGFSGAVIYFLFGPTIAKFLYADLQTCSTAADQILGAILAPFIPSMSCIEKQRRADEIRRNVVLIGGTALVFARNKFVWAYKYIFNFYVTYFNEEIELYIMSPARNPAINNRRGSTRGRASDSE